MEAEKNRKRQRRSFSNEFKVGAVRRVLNARKLPAAVARELDPSHSLVTKWVEQAQADQGRSTLGALTTVEEEELTRLRRENRELGLAEPRDASTRGSPPPVPDAEKAAVRIERRFFQSAPELA